MKKFAPTFFSVFVAFTMALGLLGQVVQPVQAAGTISLSSLGVAYTQDFNTLEYVAATGSVVPTGWAFFETGTNANTTYGVGTGSSTAGNTYSFGASGSSERAFGGLLSSSLTPTIGASFTNNTGAFITSLAISYTGEEWRMGATGRADRLDFQLSTDATSVNTGTWTDYDSLDFSTPTQSGTVGALDGNASANRTSISYTITGLGIANGSSFWIRWNDYNPSGSDDGLAVDDFSLTAAGGTSTNPTGTGAATPNTLKAGDTVLLTVAVSPGAFPASTVLAVTCNLSSIGGAANQTFYDDGTNGDVVASNNTFSFPATVDSATTAGSKNLACSISDAQSRTGNATISLSVYVVVPIGTVNGSVTDLEDATLHRSPYAPASGNSAGSTTVYVQGVIYEKTLQATTGTSTYKGFFMQNTAATKDADPNTSDGVFVYLGTYSDVIRSAGGANYIPQVGDEIILSGRVSEYYNMTEFSASVRLVSVLRSGVNLGAEVPPVVVNPPVNMANANRYWERLQGMRVQVPAESIVLGGRSVFSPADAEIWLARADSTIGQRVAPYTNRAFRDAHPLDDNYDAVNWDGNGYRILIGSLGIKGLPSGNATTLIAPAKTYETLEQPATGGVNYTFSKYRIEIEDQPIIRAGVDPSGNNPPSAIDRGTGYSIADYNLENVYDFRNNPFSGCDFLGDTGCPAVAPFIGAVSSPFNYVPLSDSDYQQRLGDIASQIVNDLHSPDILMVQEVENQDICVVTGGALVCGTTNNADGKPDILQELALKITGLGGPSYDAAFDRDSSDLRGILPAYLYRTDRVELLPAAGDPVLGSAPAVSYAGAGVAANADVSNPKTLNAVLPGGVTACETSWVFPRAVSVGLFRIWKNSIGTGNYSDVYVLNNHFKSGPDTCVGHRTEQAKYNAALIAFIESAAPGTRIVMGGDLNVYPRPDDIAYGATDQLGSLYNPAIGMTNLLDVEMSQTPEGAYSYVYLGMAQTLDQMFVSPSAFVDLNQFKVAHINSDFAAEYTGDTARGTSDHDPSVAAFNFGTGPTAATTSPLDGEQLTAGINQLTVAFNRDVLHNAGVYAADNPDNYLLVSRGANRNFDTVACGPAGIGGVQGDDVAIVINSVAYNPSTYTAVLSINNGELLPYGTYRLFVCGTSSIHDTMGNILNNGEFDTISTFGIYGETGTAAVLPATGFAPDRVTTLPAQTVSYDTLGDLWLEIPSLKVKTAIVGVPQTGSTWDVTWLGSQAGWLEGSAYPTALGNAVLTAHVWDALNEPGAFYALDKLGYGDRVIVHSYGKAYTYEVRRVMTVAPTNVDAMLKHQDDAWLTLVTCKGFNAATDQYAYRTLVRAVLVSVK